MVGIKDSSESGTEGELKRGLGQRQVSMIALGGVIGAGLFVGSGGAIASAGPGVVFAYIGVGVLVVLIMRMLSELAVASPEPGSFATYAGKEFGSWAGFSVGWVYAYMWIVVAGFEATAAAALVNHLLPGIPPWLIALVVMVVMTSANLIAVRVFGEMEFWFASIKVFTVIAFLVLGALALFGVLPGVRSPGLSNLTEHGGVFPHGFEQVLLAALVVVFSYFGTEVVTVAAGETRNPAESLRRAMRSVVVRILIFYIGSVALIVTLLPSNSTAVSKSPFVAVLDSLRIPGASQFMTFAVITAVLSNLNAGVYSSSRMVYALAAQGQAPRLLTRTTSRGVPVFAVLVASVGGFATVAADYFLPTETVFTFLLDSIGATGLVVYLAIAATQVRRRARMSRQESRALQVRMWGHPFLGIAVIALLAVVLVALLMTAGARHSTLMSLGVTAVVCVLGVVRQLCTRAGTAQRSSNSGEVVQPELEV